VSSEPEPIPKHEPTPEQDTADEDTQSATMTVEEAGTLADQLGGEVQEDVGRAFEEEALEAAAILKSKDTPAYARLKADIKASEVDTNDWKGAVKDASRAVQIRQRRQGDHRPVIEDRADIHEMVEEACEAIDELGHIWERGGELVEIREGEEGPEIRPVQKGRIRELLSRAARFEKFTQDGAKPIKPPRSIVDSVHARGNWGLDHLEGFVDGACMLEDGSILTTPGYHPDASLYLRHGADLNPADLKSPTQQEAKDARDRLVDLLCDFELVDANRQAHESAWLACLLTILARPAIGEGCTPFFLFDANRPRVGKTRMAELACIIATGRSPNPQPAPSGRDSDSEMRKTITGIARAGVPIVFFDNVKGKLGGSSLELAVTARRWSSRILGESRQWEGNLAVTWIATSNNCTLTPDMTGRTLLCRIETARENPEQRTGFKYPRIMHHVREHRAEYLQDALTMLRAWHVAGRPDHELTPWGSFEEWSHIIRNAIVHAGGADPCRTRADLADADREMTALKDVLDAWPTGAKWTAGQLADGMKGDGLNHNGLNNNGLNQPELVEAIQRLLPSTKPRAIGRKLGYLEKRAVDGKWLIQRRTGADGRRYWMAEEPDG